jgi:hypothetical protein
LNYSELRLAIDHKSFRIDKRRIAMRQGHQITRIVLVVAVVGCCVALAQEVLGNFILGTDFSKYHTYKWFSVEGSAYPNQMVDAQIKQSVDSHLASKGLTKTDDDKADLYVGYQIAVDQQKQWKGYVTGDGHPWDGMPAATSVFSTIGVGTLVLDMYDPATKQLVWTGTATKTLDPSSNQEKNMGNLDKVIQRLLKNYPPK